MDVAITPSAGRTRWKMPANSAQERYQETLRRLNRASVDKHYECYRDVDWDAPEHQIVANDPRFCLHPTSALAQSAWYRALPQDTQARLGLELLCQTFKYGIGLESALSRGLLEFVHDLPNDSLEYRYAMHELIEECQHSLMFQELIKRAGCDSVSVKGFYAFLDRRIARAGATFPTFFFFAVLTGELFADDENRELLKQADLHPLVRRIVQYHVTEEARHVRFAELYLQTHVPRLSWWQKQTLQRLAPLVLRGSAQLMLQPAPRLVLRYAIPRAVMSACFGRGSAHQARVRRIVSPLLGRIEARADMRTAREPA